MCMLIDMYDYRHGIRVAAYTERIIDFIKLDIGSKEKSDIVKAAYLHDIGKAFLDKDILNKPSKLTREEFEHCKKHVDLGMKEAAFMDFNSYIQKIIFNHHENYDGSGYHGLKGKNIVLGARIIRVVDSYDTLVNDRPYKKATSTWKALLELSQSKDWYDEFILNNFIQMIEYEKRQAVVSLGG